MNITCALTASQVKDLFKYIYKSMTDALEGGEPFNADLFMKKLFKEIADSTDKETAAKFLQQVPGLMYTGAAFVNVDIDTGKLRKLNFKYKDVNTGFNQVLNDFSPKLSSDGVMDLHASRNETSNKVAETNEPPKRQFKYKTFTAFAGTLHEYKPVNPKNPRGMFFQEELNPHRKIIYRTLERLKDLNINSSTLDSPYYQGKRIMLTAVRLTDIRPQSLVDETTKKQIVTSYAIKKKGGKPVVGEEEVTFAEDRVALVFSDENGNFLFFNENGDIVTEQEGGKLVYQFVRDVRPDKNNPGKLRVTDIYGQEDQVRTPEELYDNEVRSSGLSHQEYANELAVEGKTPADRIAEIEKEQQQEFADLRKFMDVVLKDNQRPVIPFTGISIGVAANMIINRPTFGDLIKLRGVSDDTFRTITFLSEARDNFTKGSYTITIDGKEFQIDRPNMTEDIATKIAHVLTNPNLSNAEKYKYVSLFMNNSVSVEDTVKRYNLYYNEGTGELKLKFRPYTIRFAEKNGLTAENNYQEVELIPENTQDIIDKLLAGYTYDSVDYPSRMTYNQEALSSSEYYDYNLETGKFDRTPSSYIALIKSFTDTEIYVSNDVDKDFVNSYVFFTTNLNLVEENKAVKEETKKELSIAEKKEAVVKALKEGKVLKGTLAKPLNTAGYETATQWVFRGSNGSEINFYNNPKSASVILTEENEGLNVILKLMDPIPGIDDTPVGVYAGDSFLGYVQRKVYGVGDKALDDQAKSQTVSLEAALETPDVDTTVSTQTPPSNPISDEEFLTGNDAPNPHDDEDSPFNLDRDADLPNNVTREQIDAAKEWWDNSPLAGVIGIDPMAKIVNSNVYARFSTAANILNNPHAKGKLGLIEINTLRNGNYADVYHEAWHVFSQLYLTKDAKIKLYKEIRKNPKYKNYSFLQIEEMLAEDFRDYALNPKARKGAPARNSIFRQILRFIKKFLGLIKTKDILFEKLYTGDVKNYTPLVDNIMWDMLNRGPESIDNPEVEALNTQDAREVVQSMDSIISSIIDETAKATGNKAASIAVLTTRPTPDGKSTNRDELYKKVKRRLGDRLAEFQSEVNRIGQPKNIDEQNRVDFLNDNIRIISTALDNWGDAKSGMIKYHMNRSTFEFDKQKAIAIEEDAAEDDNSGSEEVTNTERVGDKKVGEFSLAQMASSDTLYTLKTLFKIAPDGKSKVLNRFGYPELADFPSVWNNLVRAVGGIKNVEDMYGALIVASKTFPELKQLIETKLPAPGTEKNVNENLVLTNFWQDFRKTRVSYIQVTAFYDKETNTYASEVTPASYETTGAIYRFKNKFRAAEPNRYIQKVGNNNSVLNLDNIMEDFGAKGVFVKSKSFEFLRAIGFAIDDLSIIKNTLENNPLFYADTLPYIFKIVKGLADLDKKTDASEVQKTYVKKFKEDPITTLMEVIPEEVLGKEYQEKNLIERIAQLQSKYGLEGANFSVLNAAGNLVNEHIEDFTASLQIDAINQVTSANQLWTTDKYQFMSHLNPNVNPFTLRSKVLNSIFEMNVLGGDRTRRNNRKLALHAVSGTQIANENGETTTSLDKYGKMMQEMTMMLKKGLQEFMRHASKSASFGARVEGGIVVGRSTKKDPHLYVDIDHFAVAGKAEAIMVDEIFIDYISSELERIIRFRANIDEFKAYTGYNRPIEDAEGKVIGLAGEFFTAFDDVLSKEVKDQLIGSISQMDIRDVNYLHNFLDSNPKLKQDILRDITHYFTEQTNENVDFLNRNKYIDPGLKNRVSMFGLSDADAERMLVKAYTVNSWIHNFEMANLFYSDIVQANHAKDEMHKRIPGATSGGDGFRTDKQAQDFINNVLHKNRINPDTGVVTHKTYASVLNAKYNTDRFTKFHYRGTFNTAIIQDVMRSSVYIDQIEKGLREDYEERWKDVSKQALLDQFNKEERKKYANLTVRELKDKLIEQRLKAELKPYKEMTEADGQGYVTIDAYRALKNLEGKWSMEQEDLYQKIIEGKTITPAEITKFFPVYKVQNFGPLKGTNLPVNAMHKFSLVPLIPTVIKGSDLESLHEQMLASNIQYVTYDSGSKLGNVRSEVNEKGEYVADKIYDDTEQKSLIKPNEQWEGGIKFTPNTIYLEYLKNVTRVPDKFKEKTIFATQLRKLILEGMYEQGMLTNKNNLSLVRAYEAAVDEYSDILRLEILNEIGFEYKDGKYQGKLDKFLDVVQRELGRKEIPEHLIEFIGVTPNGNIKNDLSYHLEADDIEKILISLIQKRLVKQKVRGEALVQVASSMTNGLWAASPKFTNATKEDIQKFMGSNNLPFYQENIIDFNKKYADYNKQQLKDAYDGLKRVMESSQYFTPGNKYNLSVEVDYLEAAIKGKKPKVTQVKSTSAMKVAVAMQGDFNNLFKAKHLDGSTIGVYDETEVTDAQGNTKKKYTLRFDESLDRLNEMIKTEEWLNTGNNRKMVTMTAVRIPVQGLNSMEFMEVHHFLRPEAGSIIIPPSEIVAKSGSDFDVDKLTTFMPNITTDGKYSETLMTTEQIKNLILSDQVTSSEQAERLIQMQKAAIENRLIETTKDLLALPDNYANLIRPNETYLLKSIADELESKVTDYDKFRTVNGEGTRMQKGKKVISPTRVFEVGFNIHKQDVNMGGKKGLGIVALKNTMHAIFSSLGAKMPQRYKKLYYDQEARAYRESNIFHDTRLLLKHNELDGAISLANIYDVDKLDRTSDLFNHKMNGLVDVEKDSWIYNIQGVVEVIPVLSYLMMAGVPRRVAVYFASQPLVREYVERQRIMNSPHAALTNSKPERGSVKGNAAKETLLGRIGPEVISKANLLKAIDAVEAFPANTFTVTIKQEKAAVDMNKADLLKMLRDPKMNFDTVVRITPEGSTGNVISRIKDENAINKENYYYTSVAASNQIGATNFTLDTLEDLVDENDTSSVTAIAAFLHFLEIEQQIEGIESLQRISNPDTKTFKTIEEILQREYELDALQTMSKVDPNLVRQMRDESIISKFFDNQIVKDVLQPIFILRNDPRVSRYIHKVLTENRFEIGGSYGYDEDSIRLFINEFKNSIVNYAFQNYLTNTIDSDGKIVDIPEFYNDLEVVFGKNTTTGVTVTADKIIVDRDTLEKDWNNKRYLTSSSDPNNYASRGLRGFPDVENLFQSKASFFKFVLEREVLRSRIPIESLKTNKEFAFIKGFVKDEKAAYEAYLNEQALFNTFNRRALIKVDNFSFTDYFFRTINSPEFEPLKVKYPILRQFTEPKVYSGEKVITLNNKPMLKGELAEDYYKNLTELADSTIQKVKDPAENERISQMFKMLPLVSIYTNGIGYSKYGINRVLPFTQFMDKMYNASSIFVDNLDEAMLNDIFYKLTARKKQYFKDFVTPLTGATELEEVEVEAPITSLDTFTMTSGGAYGADTYFDQIGREFGLTDIRHYREAANKNLSKTLTDANVSAVVVTPEQLEQGYRELERVFKQKFERNLSNDLKARNYLQVANADAVYAIGQIIKNDTAVKGGTNAAVQMAISVNKPVYVWDINTRSWHQWDGKKFVKTGTPVLTRRFAGIGTRDIQKYNVIKDGKWVPREAYLGQDVENAAKKAIRDLFENTLSKSTKPVIETKTVPVAVSKGAVKEGVEDLFESRPELASIGTPAQYTAWLDYLVTQGKLAGTQATEILYHGTDKEFTTFDKTKRGSATGEGYFKDEEQTPIDSMNAFFFSSERAVSEQYGLLRRIEEVAGLTSVLHGLVIDPAGFASDVRKVSPALADHLNEKKKVLTQKEFKNYIKELYDKYYAINRQLGVPFLNMYNSYTLLGKQLQNLKNNKAQILSGTYVHNTFDPQHPNLRISFYKDKWISEAIDEKGNISQGEFNGRHITSLTSQEFDKLIANGEASYNNGMSEINSLLSKAKITPILYRVLLNVQRPLVKDFEGITFVNQMYEAGAQYEASKLTSQAAKSNGKYDSVIFKNIRDPYMSDNYGVFEPDQVYMLGSEEDIEGFRSFVSGSTGTKLTGDMTYAYGKNKRSDVKADTTFDAILSGERTATTRYESDGNIDYWKQAKVGDIITWKSADGRTVDVVVTKALHKIKGSGKTVNDWSKLEGWSVDYFNAKVLPKVDQAWQIEFKLATQPSTQPTVQPTTRKTYSGKVTSLQPDQIFVFGSNPEGRHGAGAAKYAKDNFGAIYGQGEGLQGQSYALPTKDLRVKENNSLRSISPEDITSNIRKLYDVARQNPNKEFLVSDYSESNLNGYSGQEMANMFSNAGPIPSNIVFNENFDKLITTQPTVQPTEVKEGVTITYTPVGKTEQTYTIIGSKIFNKDGKEVFKEDSRDRNKIFANLAIKEGRAVIVLWKGSSYVVNNKDQIISVKTGDIMKWGPENGDRKGILETAKAQLKPSVPEVTPSPVVSAPAQRTTGKSIFDMRQTPIEYTSGQVKALSDIEEIILDADNSSQSDFYLLAGYAGTGKTTIAENIAKFAQANYMSVRVIAPTNKAAEVLTIKLKQSGVRNVDPQTIHAAIYGAPDPETKEWILAEPIENSVIIVDESSMISKSLMADLIEQVNDNNNIVIFMGDGFQLEQIGEDARLFGSLTDPSLFKKTYGVDLKGSTMLTEVRRQSFDSNILKYATLMRADKTPYIPNVSLSDFKVERSKAAFEQQFQRDVAQGEDVVMVVATNPERVQMNTLARSAKYPAGPKVIEEGDILISIANSIPAKNSEILPPISGIDQSSVQTIPLMIAFDDNTNAMYNITLFQHEIISPKGEKFMEDVVLVPGILKPSLYHSVLFEAIKKSPEAKRLFQDRGLIEKIHQKDKRTGKVTEKEQLAKDVIISTYGYAITGHKSQGSQWRKVYVNQNFVAPSWDAARWFYTAVTRAAEEVVVLPSQYQTAISNSEADTKLDQVLSSQTASISDSDPELKLKTFFDSLTPEEKRSLAERQKINTLEDLIEDYNNQPRRISVDQYIEIKKTC